MTNQNINKPNRRGFIRIYRDILDDQIWEISKYLRGWVFLQVKASHSDSNMENIKLKRGDFFIGFKKMMASLNFKSEEEVVQFLDYLVEAGKITYVVKEKSIHGHLINYETDQPAFNKIRKFNDADDEIPSSTPSKKTSDIDCSGFEEA